MVRAVSTMAGTTLFCTRSTLPMMRGCTRLGQGSWVTGLRGLDSVARKSERETIVICYRAGFIENKTDSIIAIVRCMASMSRDFFSLFYIKLVLFPRLQLRQSNQDVSVSVTQLRPTLRSNQEARELKITSHC